MQIEPSDWINQKQYFLMLNLKVKWANTHKIKIFSHTMWPSSNNFFFRKKKLYLMGMSDGKNINIQHGERMSSSSWWYMHKIPLSMEEEGQKTTEEYRVMVKWNEYGREYWKILFNLVATRAHLEIIPSSRLGISQYLSVARYVTVFFCVYGLRQFFCCLCLERKF